MKFGVLRFLVSPLFPLPLLLLPALSFTVRSLSLEKLDLKARGACVSKVECLSIHGSAFAGYQAVLSVPAGHIHNCRQTSCYPTLLPVHATCCPRGLCQYSALFYPETWYAHVRKN